MSKIGWYVTILGVYGAVLVTTVIILLAYDQAPTAKAVLSSGGAIGIIGAIWLPGIIDELED